MPLRDNALHLRSLTDRRMETEFKLSCSPPTATALVRHLTRLTGMRPQRLQLKNTYYDTPQQDLRSRGIALRIRQQGSVLLQTVKCAGQVHGGLSKRPEWETPYTGHLDFGAVDDTDVRTQLECLARLPGYRATLRTDFSRNIWHWQPDALTEIEIALDRGSISAGGREESICELELELVKGSVEQLLDLVRRLGTLVPLFPAPLSKAARGSLLIDGRAKISSQLLPSQASNEAAFLSLAQECLDQVSMNLPANRGNFDADNLHQIRVGLRRLRALLQLFRPGLYKSWRQTAEKGAKQHMRYIAAARSHHVLIETLLTPARASLTPVAGQRLQTRLESEALAAFEQAREHLLSQDFADWLLQISLGLHAPLLQPKFGPRRWSKTAQSLLKPHLAAYAKAIKDTTSEPEELHELRKHGKHLRYQILVTGAVNKPVLKHLARLQNTLGQLNDLYCAGEILEPLAQRSPALGAVIRQLGNVYLPQHEAWLATVPKQLTQLRSLLATDRKGTK